MKLSDYVANFLAKHTGHVFVGNGSCIIHLLDSLDKNKKLRLVPCQNEQAAAIAADAYYRVSKKIGVAVATSGPGVANLIQGIACAYFDSIPNLYITGAPPRAHLKGRRRVRQIGFQEMDVVEIMRSLTKYTVLLIDPEGVKYELEKLLFTAFADRPGPVLLDLPDDLQRAQVNPQRLESFIPPGKPDLVRKAKLGKVLKLIRKAERPAVIVGAGVKLAGAEKELNSFLQKSAIPFATTWATIDMFLERNPRLIGNFGVSANRAGNFAVQNADLLISLGSRLDTHQTGSKPANFAPQAKKIVVDIDNAELNKNNGMNIDLKINCDAAAFLKALNAVSIKTRDLKPWVGRIQDWKARYPVCLPEYYRQKHKVNPYVFMNELSQQTKKGAIIAADAGATATWTMQAYKIYRPGQILISAFNHATMGYALPATIGAQFAAPQRQVICISGDGGMQMNIQELETIAYNQLPIKIFLINNKGYGIIKQTQDTWMNSRYVAADPGSGLGFPNFRKVARAYGLKTESLSNFRELRRVIKKVLDYQGPLLCDVKVEPSEKITPKLEFGRSIEEMSPLLPEDEMKANMLDE